MLAAVDPVSVRLRLMNRLVRRNYMIKVSLFYYTCKHTLVVHHTTWHNINNNTVLSRCYAPFVVTPPPPPPPLFSAKLLLRVTFCSLIRPPHLHMHTCVWLALTSMFTLVLRCYYVVIFAKCVRLFPCRRLRTCGTGLWQRYCCVGSGGVTTQRCMQFSLLRPPPSSARSYVSKGGA